MPRAPRHRLCGAGLPAAPGHGHAGPRGRPGGRLVSMLL